jgi:hypothetical protein
METKILILPLILIFFLTSCQQEPKFPDTPEISFVSFEKVDSSTTVDDQGILTLHFQDGDGDIGLDEDDTETPFDTSSIYYYNFFIKYFEKQNGEFVAVELPMTNNARIPRLSDDVPESIEGDISITLYINNYTSQYDTIRFECYIVDRELHQSNTITTPEIIINK